MENNVLNRMVELLDIQEKHCADMGATVYLNCLAKPKSGNFRQNSYYFGNLNMAQAIALEMHKDIVKRDGKHIVIDMHD
jgi:hypothetical protein